MKIRIVIMCLALYNCSYLLSQESRQPQSYTLYDEITIPYEAPRNYAKYFSEYKINDNLFFRIENHRTTFNSLTSETNFFEYPLLAKYYITKNLSFLGGPKLNILEVDGTIKNISTSFSSGFIYEVNDNMYFDGVFNAPINGKDLNSALGVSYRLGTKVKF